MGCCEAPTRLPFSAPLTPHHPSQLHSWRLWVGCFAQFTPCDRPPPALPVSPALPCHPPPQLRWWRLVIDEAQMVGGGLSAAGVMCERLEAVHRWCVTGEGAAGEQADGGVSFPLCATCLPACPPARLPASLPALPPCLPACPAFHSPAAFFHCRDAHRLSPQRALRHLRPAAHAAAPTVCRCGRLGLGRGIPFQLSTKARAPSSWTAAVGLHAGLHGGGT